MSKNIDDLRAILFETIDQVREGKMDLERAKMVGDLSQVMVNSAMVEVKFVQATGQKGSTFLEKSQELPPGITGVRQHRMIG
jgi:hypothetical protein